MCARFAFHTFDPFFTSFVGAECDDASLHIGVFSGYLFAQYGNRRHDHDGDSWGTLASSWRSRPVVIDICCHVHV